MDWIGLVAAIVTAIGAIVAACIGRKKYIIHKHESSWTGSPLTDDVGSRRRRSAGSWLVLWLVVVVILNTLSCAGFCITSFNAPQQTDPLAAASFFLSLLLLGIGCSIAVTLNKRTPNGEKTETVIGGYLALLAIIAIIVSNVVAAFL